MIVAAAQMLIEKAGAAQSPVTSQRAGLSSESRRQLLPLGLKPEVKGKPPETFYITLTSNKNP